MKSEPAFMKSIYTLFLLMICAGNVAAQHNEDYYNPVTEPLKPSYDPVEPKIRDFKKDHVTSLLSRYGGVRFRNRWYIGIDGFVRTDKNTINNTFNGLIDTKSGSKYGYSVSLGWVNQEKWTLELEYARSPVHNILVINGYYPAEFKIENEKNNIAFRAKRRLLFGNGNSSVRRPAFWVSAGAGIVPNSGKQTEYLEFEGYVRRGRQPIPDTLYMRSESRTNQGLTGFADVTAEYIVKLARGLDLSVYGRKRWGLGNSMTTRLGYYVNKVEMQQATIKGDGRGWALGVSLRYVFSLGYDFDDRHNPE
jgi:hypothetical protein